MRRILLVLSLLTLPVLADRAAFKEAVKTLRDSYLDELAADKRDRLFEQLRGYDKPEAAVAMVEIISGFGTYMGSLEGELAELQGKLAPFKGRRGLTEQEIGLRNRYIRKIEKREVEWRRARVSEDLLVKIVGEFKDKKTIQKALPLFQKHTSWRVRQVLARACSHWHEQLKDARLSKKAFAVLKKLRVDKETGVRIAVARSLGAFKRMEALELLKLSIEDADWRVRSAAVKSLLGSRSNDAVTILIARMKKEKGRLKDDINKGLQALSGENYGFADSWERWWASVGQRLPARPKGGGGLSEEKKAKDTAAFYGIPTRSERVLFIIDISGSMNKEVEQFKRVVITGRKNSEMAVEGKTRLEVARNELKRAISNLNQDKYFSIIFFNHAVKNWRPEMTQATRKVKGTVRKELDAIVASGTTYTLGALREAFVLAGVLTEGGKTRKVNQVEVDTIFLLSDGGPTDNRMEGPKPMDPEIILDSVKQWNRDAGIVIHAIAVDTDAAGTYFLKQIAAQNGGVFVERKH